MCRMPPSSERVVAYRTYNDIARAGGGKRQADFDVSQLLLSKAACCSDEEGEEGDGRADDGHILRSISKENSISSQKNEEH